MKVFLIFVFIDLFKIIRLSLSDRKKRMRRVIKWEMDGKIIGLSMEKRFFTLFNTYFWEVKRTDFDYFLQFEVKNVPI